MSNARTTLSTGRRWGVWVLVVATLLAAGGWALEGAPVRASEPTRFAASMPRGALAYLELRDLGGLMKQWLASPSRGRYYASASYRAFRRSRLYLKLQDRLSDLQEGFGFELTEENLAKV